MTDLEIDRALALAIGWREEQTGFEGDHFCVEPNPKTFVLRRFSHLDPRVIWPIAERFRCFPKRWPDESSWIAVCGTRFIRHYNPATAVALAVIAAARTGMK